jgi:hypothetical protein
MKALEFRATPNPEGTLSLPKEVAAQLPVGQPVRILVLVEDADEEQDWSRLTAEQFLAGYAPEDAIYDHLPPG